MSKFIIEIRTKGFGTAETELKRVNQQTRTFARRANKSADAGASFRREVSQLRNNMLLYTFAIGGAITGMGKFVMAASDAREQASKFKVVFGDFAPEAEQFAQSITNSFGIAKSEIIGLLASLQDTFVPLGFSREQASELSQSIAQLSLDVGSFNNIATGDVARRFTSAIIGNHEAVRELGISLTEVSIKQEAQRLGIIGVNEQMTQTAKVLGRMSLIYRNTTDAQGDLIRTQDEFANRLRGVQGQFREFSEDLGESLIPFAELGLEISSFIVTGPRLEAVLIAASSALLAYSTSSFKAMLATDGLSAAMRRNLIFAAGAAFFIAIDAAMEKIEDFGRGTVEASYDVQDLDELVNKLAGSNLNLSGATEEATKAALAHAEALKKQAEAVKQSEKNLEVRLAVMLQQTELDKARVAALFGENRILTEKEIKILAEIDRIKEKNKAEREELTIKKELIEKRRLLIDGINATTEAQSEAAIIQAQLDGANDLQIEKMRIVNTAAMELGNVIGGPDGLGSAYTTLKNTIGNSTEALTIESLGIETENALVREQLEAIIDLVNKKLLLADANAKAAASSDSFSGSTIENNKRLREAAEAARETAGELNAVAGAIRLINSEADEKQQLQGFIQLLSGMVSASNPVAGGALNIFGALVGHTGGLVKNNGIQRFATGGMVQGQDNVPILAQAGEFIMQRSAVQNIGVQNLAAMNSGQTSGGVTINIQGNMIGNDEFVRDNLIPQIKKASEQNLA